MRDTTVCYPSIKTSNYHRCVHKVCVNSMHTVEPLLRGHHDESPTPVERPIDTKAKHKCIDFYPCLEATPLERPLFW